MMSENKKAVLKGDEKLLETLKEIAVLIGDDPDLIKAHEDYVTVPEKTEKFLTDLMEDNGGEVSVDEAFKMARRKAIRAVADINSGFIGEVRRNEKKCDKSL